MTPVVLVLIAFSILATASPKPVHAGGPLAEHLRNPDVYGEDWPHYAPWVHSEIKVADDVKAYNLRPVDFECNLLPGVPARGVLVAYATQTELGLAFVNETGELLKLREVSIGVSPKYREGLDFDYISGSNGEKDVLMVWGADKLYMLHVRLGVERLHEDANLPTVVDVSNITAVDLPPGYKDVRRVRVLALGNEFVVFFTARRENRPTEEYGYDLFYVIARIENRTVKLEMGPADLGFQDVIIFQVRKLPLETNGTLLGLTVMGRWRQHSAGVWWTTIRLEGNSIKVIQVTRISDDNFEIPCVSRALLDFGCCLKDDKCYVLVVWNDSRFPEELEERIKNKMPNLQFKYQKDNTWVLYGERFIIDKSGYIEEFIDRDKNGNPKNFPVVYLMIITQVGTQTTLGEMLENWSIKFGEIESIALYTAPGPSNERYFVVDASINTSDVAVSGWLLYALSGVLEVEKNTYGFDIFSVPVPMEGDGVIATEVDKAYEKTSVTKFGTKQTEQKWVAYPVFVKFTNSTRTNVIGPLPKGFIYLYDTIQFSEMYAAKVRAAMPDQVDIKVGQLGGVIVEGFIETKVESASKNYTGPLFVIPVVAVVGPIRDVYKDYDDGRILKDYVYEQGLNPFTVLKFRPIRTEDHPAAQAGRVVYDLRSQPPALPTAGLEVSYTTDFTDRVPLGSGLVEIIGPTRPEKPVPGAPLSGYAVMNGKEILMKSRNVDVTVLRILGKTTNKEQEETTKVCVRFLPVVFLPPIVEALECVARVVESGVVDEGTLRAAQNALDRLNKLDERDLPRDVRDYLAYLRKVLEDLCNYAGEEMKKSNTKRVSLDTKLIIELNAAIIGLKRIVEGTYHVFVLYHPMGTVKHYPEFIDDKTKSLFDELAYTGVLSWVPIDVKCEVPTATLRRGRTGVRPGTAVPPTEAPVVLPPTKPTGTQPTQPQKREERKVTTPPKVRKPTGGTPRRVPLLPVIPYRRGLSRPRLRRRSCTFRAR